MGSVRDVLLSSSIKSGTIKHRPRYTTNPILFYAVLLYSQSKINSHTMHTSHCVQKECKIKVKEMENETNEEEIPRTEMCCLYLLAIIGGLPMCVFIYYNFIRLVISISENI